MTDQTTALAERPGLEPISPEEQAAVLEQVIMHGDLARLTPPQRIAYYRQVCDTLHLNPFTKPFQYINLEGRLTLYPTRDATDQMRRNHGISVTHIDRVTDVETGIHMVTVEGRDSKGRTDSAVGAVSIKNLTGQNLANAFMKAETKGKRRLTLSLAGLGMFDESEVGDIANAVPVEIDDEGNVVDVGASVGELRPITQQLAEKLAERKAAQGVLVDAPETSREQPKLQPQPATDGEAMAAKYVESTKPVPDVTGTLVHDGNATAAEIIHGTAGPLGVDTISPEEQDEPEPIPVAPGQEPLFDAGAAVVGPPDENLGTPIPGGHWSGVVKGEAAEDILTAEDEGIGFTEPAGSQGLKLKMTLEAGEAVVALHGPALADFYQLEPEPTEGSKLRVEGILRLVPWNKAGKAQPPYRRILARYIGAG